MVTAALRNAARLTGRSLSDLLVVCSGAGAAGIAVSRMLLEAGVGDLAIVDSKGIVHLGCEDLNASKAQLATESPEPEIHPGVAHASGAAVVADELAADSIIPSVFDPRVAPRVARAVAQAAREAGVARP